MNAQKDGGLRDRLLHLWAGQVPPQWADYNGHMTEHRYLQIFGESTTGFLALVGLTAEGARESTYYTLETHLRHVKECQPGVFVKTSTEILGYDSKRLHLYHRLLAYTGELLATGEQLHVHIAHSKVCAASAALLERLSTIFESQRDLPRPERSGLIIVKDLEFTRGSRT